jgi:hypothetical protein
MATDAKRAIEIRSDEFTMLLRGIDLGKATSFL